MSIVCDLEEKEELRVARFIKGLTPALATKVDIQNYDGFSEVCRLALKFEKHDKARKPYAYSKGSSSGASSYFRPAPSKPKETPKEETKDKGKGVVEPKGNSLRRCFKCQGYGHIANECLRKRALTAQELYDTISVFVTPEEETVQENVGADGEGKVYDLDPLIEEECLVLRNLHMETRSAENEQREQIFHTRCKVNRKICNLIIDSGSCANVVARDLVDDLKLQTRDRVKPYKLHWLNGENGIQVKKQDLVSLSLKPYTDEVWCDIISMNACHILLSRPWQFDRWVEHNGRSNVYSVMKGNVKYNLKPISPNKIKESKIKKGSMFMEAREVEEALARRERTYVLMVRELGSIGVSENRGVQGLLEEFRDVFPDELPIGLPPLRGIEHQLDLIPGAALPNKPAYRCNPEEAKELQRQVQELMDRGYVQESLSPCAVPALLVPKKEGTWRMCIDSRGLVMPFGLCNAPSSFMRLLNEVLRPFLNKFVVVYLDDILVYSKDEELHNQHLQAVFVVLRNQKLYGKLEKCTFMLSSVVFLGYIVGKDGVSMDPSKVDDIQAWPLPKSTTKVGSFHGLASFYRRFIQGFSSIMAPITELTKKGEFVWTSSAQKAFEDVKHKSCFGLF
ncbi:uncharacterized protein LOC141637858 [Silene latifolia]|uniref:uncharacterized protein LOC141637858 n=1 Tax=Silene latifolia TaxID=37657 RepID=UPI003D774D8E